MVARAELQEDVMRFADRYGARMVLVGDHLLAQAQTTDERALALGWKLASRVAVVAIAVGPDEVTNLLDMLVLAGLTRLQVEEYWVPEVIGADKGKELLEAARILEEDIWSVADRVLTPGQQQELRILIKEWHDRHPGQHYFWDVRFSEFAGQRAASLEQIADSGGLLGQVQQTRESVDEIRALGERVLYYMQHAAALTRLQVQFGAYEMLRLPEMQNLLRGTDRFNTSVERFATVAETLPQTRLEAINQFMDRLTEQREGLLDDLLSEEARVRAVFTDLQQTIALGNELAKTVNSTVQTVDQLANKLGRRKDEKAAQEFDIEDYRQFIVEARDTAGEFTQFVQSLEILMSTEAWEEQRPQALRMVYEIDTQIEALIMRIFVLSLVLIVVFFLALFAYRYAAARTGSGSKGSAA